MPFRSLREFYTLRKNGYQGKSGRIYVRARSRLCIGIVCIVQFSVITTSYIVLLRDLLVLCVFLVRYTHTIPFKIQEYRFQMENHITPNFIPHKIQFPQPQSYIYIIASFLTKPLAHPVFSLSTVKSLLYLYTLERNAFGRFSRCALCSARKWEKQKRVYIERELRRRRRRKKTQAKLLSASRLYTSQRLYSLHSFLLGAEFSETSGATFPRESGKIRGKSPKKKTKRKKEHRADHRARIPEGFYCRMRSLAALERN